MMGYQMKRMLICLLSAVLCLAMLGCREEKKQMEPAPSTEGGAILSAGNSSTFPSFDNSASSDAIFTPVYATAFEDTVILATVPIQEWHGMEAECPAREISNGGRIRCNEDHEEETPITRVLFLEDVYPRVCSGWFRDMIHLEKVEGAERLHTESVTDMSFMFSGCEKLTTLDYSSWDVSALEDTTGMFDNCVALQELPQWYLKTE